MHVHILETIAMDVHCIEPIYGRMEIVESFNLDDINEDESSVS